MLGFSLFKLIYSIILVWSKEMLSDDFKALKNFRSHFQTEHTIILVITACILEESVYSIRVGFSVLYVTSRLISLILFRPSVSFLFLLVYTISYEERFALKSLICDMGFLCFHSIFAFCTLKL